MSLKKRHPAHKEPVKFHKCTTLLNLLKGTSTALDASSQRKRAMLGGYRIVRQSLLMREASDYPFDLNKQGIFMLKLSGTSKQTIPLRQMEKRKGWIRTIRGMGIAAFVFFLVKGLIWLFVFFGLARISGC